MTHNNETSWTEHMHIMKCNSTVNVKTSLKIQVFTASFKSIRFWYLDVSQIGEQTYFVHLKEF
jgi:hypothetical protein